MAREISVRAEILRRFRRGHITLVQSYTNRSQPSSDVVPTGRPSGTIAEDGSWRFRQRQGRGTKWHCGNVQHFLLHRQVQEESSIATFVLCVSRIRIELSRCTHIFLQCITFGAKILRVLLFLGLAFMNVARHDIITKMSVLVGNPCVCQLCIGWRYHQTVSKLTSFSQYGRASTFW